MRDIYDDALDAIEAEETQAPGVPVAAAAPSDPDIYDRAFDQIEADETDALQPMLDLAMQTAPDVFASTQALAKSSGLPAELVERNLEAVKRSEQIKVASRVLQDSPTLRRQIADPDFARLAHEDIEQLGALERVAQGLKESGSSLVAGLYSGSAGVVGYAEAAAGLASRLTKPLAGTVLPADLGGLVHDSARDYRQSIQAYAKGWRPESSGILGKGWHAGIESFARNLPGIPLMLMPGGANAALLGMTLPVAGEEFGAARDKGLGLLESMIYGASQGVIEYGTEKLPMTKLLGDIAKGTGLTKMLAKQVIYEAPTEQLATVLQDLNKWAALEINEGKTFGDYITERPEAAAITLVATLVGTTGQTTVVHGMQKTLERVYGEAARAQLDVDIIERLAEAQRIVQSLQLTQINPASLEEYLQSLTEDSDISDLYIDASAIVDAGLVDQLSAVSPSVAEQIEQAVELGQQVRIPVEELLAQVAPSGVADALVDHLRTSPDGKTRAEAEEYLQRVSEEYRQQSAGVIEASAEQIAFDAELTAYGDQLVEQLDAIGAYRHDHNVVLASVHKGLIGALAQRAGMSPSDFIARYGVLRVINEEVARSEDGTRATLEYLEKAYLDAHVDYERALSEGGDVDAAAAVRAAAKERLDAVRSGGIGSWQPPAELRPELAAMDFARSELDAARRAFDDAFQAGLELPIDRVRESSSKMAKAIDAAFGGELAIVSDRLGGGRIEVFPASDGSGWVVWRHNEAGEVERGDAFTDRVSAIEAFLGDAELAGMSFKAVAAAGSQAAPAVSPIAAAREAAEAAAAEVAAFELATDQGQEIDADAYWAALDRHTNALRGLQAELEALPDDGFALEAATPMGMVMSLTASAQQPGKWQLTRFDQAGEPWGDTQYETKGEAILEFLSDADVSTVRDFGGQLNQRGRPFGGEEVARTPLDTVRTAWQEAGIDFTLVESGDVVTVSKIVVPEGAREAGAGTRAMEQLVAWADANGKHLALTPSADFGGNAKRLTAFYKRFGFKENKGKSRVFSVSEGMIRENPNGKVLYSFAGQNAETADIYSLVDAKERLAKGEGKERVRRETGWFRGVDGRWRFEITDDGASIKTQGMPNAGSGMVMSDILDHPKLFAAYPDLEFMRVTFVDNAGFGGKYSPGRDEIEISVNNTDGDELLSVLMHEIQHAIQQREGFAKGGMPDGDFSKWVKGALDQLESVERERVEQWKWRDGYHATQEAERASELVRHALMYESALRLMSYANRERPSSVFRLIRNEMQWIYGEEFRQDEEAQELQRAFYAIPKPSKMRERNAFLLDMAARAADLLKSKIPDEVLHDFRSDERTTKSMVAALRRQADLARKELEPQHELERAYRNAQALNKAHKYSTPFDIYKALAGEVEARNTQSRLTMNEDERRAKSPIFTADVPAEQVIVMFGGLDIQAPMASVSAQPTPRGSFNPATNTVALLKDANLSTFIHETGHYGLETLVAVASDISAKSADQITESERGMLRDVATLMQWFGVRDITEWSMMSFEEKRGHHERFAESFERYVMEGRAPSVELGGAFATMRRMMISVYQTIKNMIARNPDAGALSDEVRQVFDRMIATDEQIEMQARVRSMLPLFESMEQADAIGATIEDWDQYQRDAEGAVDQAKAELAAAGVRDMKWLDGARSRALKRLQKHVAALREEAEMQARREVMTQPVYRAWQFLTGKVGEESQLPTAPKRKSDPNTVDPSIDSLFVAIAKLGGIDRAELESEWGLDPKERIAQAGFGKHVLRRNGGRSIDEMRSLLVQYGYLDPNESDPNWNPREFEERFFEELGGVLHYSSAADYAYLESLEMLPGQQALSPDQITAGRLDLDGLAAIGIPAEIIAHLKNLRMTARAGWHPDVLVETFDFGFDSGDALVRTIAAAPSLDDAIRARTDEIMLERHSDLATPEGLKSAADEAVLSDLRAKVVASQLKALTRATGSELDLRRAARSVAAEIVARLKVRNVRPSIYSAAEARASKASAAALAKDDIETAAREQRNQLLSLYSAKEAYAALREVDSAVKYLARFEGDAARKSISQDYLDQILEITSRFDLRKGVSLKEIDRVTSLQEWIEAQRDEGIEPDIPEWLKSGVKRTHYKNLTVAELRDVVDTIKHIEHLGRLKNRLLTARDNRTLAQVVSEIAASMEAASGGRVIDNQRRNELSSIVTHGARGFMAMHRQLHSLVREMDGFADFGPFWRALVMPMNAAGDREASMRADAAKRLHELAKPVLAEAGKMGGKGQFVPSLGRSLNRGERLAILLNWGNEGNKQRLLDGYGWKLEQLEPILNSFSRAELDFAQGVWDFFESYRPLIAAKERRVNGKEPEWIEPSSFTVQTREGDAVTLRGGYYPVKYDVNQSGEAARNAEADFADMARRAARVSATTRRGYTKNRAEKVVGRPVALSFDGIYSGANEVIHDLAWHEWLIDAGRLLRKLDPVIRNRYGAEYVTEITKLLGDIAQGDTPATNAFESTLQHLRNGATIAGLGWNLTTSLLQFTGFANSVVRLGGAVDGSVWLARGLREFYGSPGHMMRKIEEAQGKSEFMRNRAMTMNRDINDIVNRLDKGKSDIRLKIEASFFVLIQKAQMMVDYPTWYAAYEKAMADPATVREDGTIDEALAIAFADQMVVSAQAGGTTKDLARVQRGGPLLKLFTNFYSYFAATLQIAVERTKATDFRKPSNVAMLAGDYLLLMVIPAMLGMIIRAFMKGEDLDDDEWIDRIAAEQIGFIMGMTPITREMTLAVQALGGVGGRFDYAGPAGLRFFAELQKLGVQVSQGELDMPLFRAANNTAGVLFHYPAGQVGRTVAGAVALIDGETSNPAVLVAGPPKN